MEREGPGIDAYRNGPPHWKYSVYLWLSGLLYAHLFTAHHLIGVALVELQQKMLEVYDESHVFWITLIAKRFESTIAHELRKQEWGSETVFQELWERKALFPTVNVFFL